MGLRLSEADLLAIQARGRKIYDQVETREKTKNTLKKLTGVNHANRGMSFQHLITEANKQYKFLKIADIFEPGVPGKIVSDSNATSTGGKKIIYLPATVDHLGSWSGRAIAFDDKSTDTRELPAKNVKDHQMDFLLEYQSIGKAICFLLIGYAKLGRFFVVDIDKYCSYWIARKGFKINDAEKVGREVFAGRVCLDYLKAFEEG